MQNKYKNVKILLTGGGTGGSVMPLLAIADALRVTRYAFEFIWLGTKNGPEREMVKKEKIEFKPISSGKLRRYFSWQNFIDPFLIFIGFIQSLFIILKRKPDLVISAGSFVSVPVAWAAWLLHVPVLIHQQDARPGLANKSMAPFASIITVTFEKSLRDYGKKAVWLGNFVRNEFIDYKIDKREARQKFGLRNDKPVVLIIGGGTGAIAINKLVEQSLGKLTKFCQIIHIIGKDKKGSVSKLRAEPSINYHSFEFLHINGIIKAFTAADIVVSRCGMGVLTELSCLGKPSILIPMPGSHQEENAQIFKEREAAVVLDQKKLTAEEFIDSIKKLLDDELLRGKLRNNIKTVIKSGANEKIVRIVERVTRNT